MYEGNCKDQHGAVTDLLPKYRGYMHMQENPAQVPKFTRDMIKADCQGSSNTSAGWDQWEHADWKNLSDTACQRMADMLNAIEAGHDWPEPATWGKAHLPSKEDTPSLDPMGYRILLVMQRLYRRWASMRIQHLDAWIRGWQLEEMFAGVKGGGADTAWLSTALDSEKAAAELADRLLGMLDIWKCFDQIIPCWRRSRQG